jgi:hypothetical protein
MIKKDIKKQPVASFPVNVFREIATVVAAIIIIVSAAAFIVSALAMGNDTIIGAVNR